MTQKDFTKRYLERFVDYAGIGRIDLLKKIVQVASPESLIALLNLPFKATEDAVSPTTSGKTALFNAVVNGHVDVTEYLLILGSPVDTKCFNRTPLYEAVRSEHVALVELLRRYNANPNELCRHGQSPVELAKEKGLNYFKQ